MRQRKSLLNYAHNEHQLNIRRAEVNAQSFDKSMHPASFYLLKHFFFSRYLTGWPVQNDPPVPVHRLARARGAKNRRGLHRFHRTSAQNQGTVRTGWTNHCTLQVERKRRRTSITKSNLSVEVEWTAPAPQLVFFFFLNSVLIGLSGFLNWVLYRSHMQNVPNFQDYVGGRHCILESPQPLLPF